MNWFDMLVGISSICSFLVAIIALFKVDKIEKHVVKKNKTSQIIKGSTIQSSSVKQVSINNKGD